MSATGSPFDAFDLPPPWPEALIEGIRARNKASATRLVILDDDPLGGQCLHDVPVLTTWDVRALAEELERSPAFLLLTNTRALPRDEAIRRSEDVGHALRQAAQQTGIYPTPVWRSDSTLRGHFYWEMSALTREFDLDGMPRPVYVFLPYFGDGRRYTLNDTQYVLHSTLSRRAGQALIPVADTEFARDPTYAFEHSHLPSWLEAHSEGRFAAADVTCISLDDLRSGGPDRVAALLRQTGDDSAVIVNAVADSDLEVFVAGLQAVEAEGRPFLCSGAASFIRVRAGQASRPPLTAIELGLTHGTGGLTIVGSYVDKTSEQLRVATGTAGVAAIELKHGASPADVASVVQSVADVIGAGRDAVLYAPREHSPGAASAIAGALTEVLLRLDVRPRYLLCKGGSTASQLATQALGVRRATVLGQLMPGVPVWRLGDECRWPGMTLVIFPGNVGTPSSLAEALQTLGGAS